MSILTEAGPGVFYVWRSGLVPTWTPIQPYLVAEEKPQWRRHAKAALLRQVLEISRWTLVIPGCEIRTGPANLPVITPIHGFRNIGVMVDIGLGPTTGSRFYEG